MIKYLHLPYSPNNKSIETIFGIIKNKFKSLLKKM